MLFLLNKFICVTGSPFWEGGGLLSHNEKAAILQKKFCPSKKSVQKSKSKQISGLSAEVSVRPCVHTHTYTHKTLRSIM